MDRFLKGRLRHPLAQILELDARVISQVADHLDRGDEPGAVLVLEQIQQMLDSKYAEVLSVADSMDAAREMIPTGAEFGDRWTVRAGYTAYYETWNTPSGLEYSIREYHHDGRSGHYNVEFTVFVWNPDGTVGICD